MTTTKKLLAVTLTENEVADRGRMAAALAQEQTRIEEERKATDAKYRERIAGLRARIAGVQAEIRDGAKLIEVPVEWRTDWQRNVKELVRLDTGDVVEVEALTADERQTELFVLKGGETPREDTESQAG